VSDYDNWQRNILPCSDDAAMVASTARLDATLERLSGGESFLGLGLFAVVWGAAWGLFAYCFWILLPSR
jgi:hypothetical protein